MGFGSSSSNLSPLAPPFTVDRGPLSRQGTIPLVDVTEPSFPPSGASSYQIWSNTYHSHYPLTGSVSIRRQECDPLLSPTEESLLYGPRHTSSPLPAHNPTSSACYDATPEVPLRYSSYLSNDGGSLMVDRSRCDRLSTSYPETSTASPSLDYSLQRSGLWGKSLVDWPHNPDRDASLSVRGNGEGFYSNEGTKKCDEGSKFAGMFRKESYNKPSNEFQEDYKPVVSQSRFISDVTEEPVLNSGISSPLHKPCPPPFASVQDFKSHPSSTVTITQSRIPQSTRQYLTKQRFPISDICSGDSLYGKNPLPVGIDSPMQDFFELSKIKTTGHDERKETGNLCSASVSEGQPFMKLENNSDFRFLWEEKGGVTDYGRSRIGHRNKCPTSTKDFGVHSFENPPNNFSLGKFELKGIGSAERYVGNVDLLNSSEDSPCWIPRLRKDDDCTCSSVQSYDATFDGQIYSMQQQSEKKLCSDKKGAENLESSPKMSVPTILHSQGNNGAGKSGLRFEENKVTTDIPKEGNAKSEASVKVCGKTSHPSGLQNLEHAHHPVDSATGANVSQTLNNLVSAHDYAKTTADISNNTKPKISIQTLVNALHNLSEVLLFNCSNESCELKENQCVILKSVMENLDRCMRKNDMVSSNLPNGTSDVCRPFDFNKGSYEKRLLHQEKDGPSIGTEPVKESYNFIENSNPSELKQENITQAIKKILVENFSVEDGALSESSLYKNLWLEAEAALCSASYMCRFNRMKMEFEDRSNNLNIGKQPSPLACTSPEMETTTNNGLNATATTELPEKIAGSYCDHKSRHSCSSLDSIPYMSWLSYPKSAGETKGFTDTPSKNSSLVSETHHSKDNEASILASYSILNNWVDESNRQSSETDENVIASSCSQDMAEDSVLARINILKCRDRMLSQSMRD